VDVLPYFLGKIFGNYIEYIFYAIAFLTGYYPFLQSRGRLIDYWLIFLLLHLAISGLVNIIMLINLKSNQTSIKQTICVGLIVILWSFAGISPKYDTIISNLGSFGSIIIQISPFSYSQQLEFIIELESYPDIFNNISDRLLSTFHFDLNHKHICIIVLILYWVISNIIAYIILKISRWRRLNSFIDAGLCSSRVSTMRTNK